MNAAPRQCIQIGRESGHEGLALTRFHLGNVATVQENAAHQLHVKGAQSQRAAGSFSAVGECLWQQRVQILASACTLLQRMGLVDDALIAERLELGFKRVDLFDQRPDAFDQPVILRPKDLFRECA